MDEALRGKEWLVGGKCSAADLSYVSFHSLLPFILGEEGPDVKKEYPSVGAWYERLEGREAVRKVLEDHRAVFSK